MTFDCSEGVSFTYEIYRDLLAYLRDNGYTFSDYQQNTGENKTVILRHDVDWSPAKALKMAEIEAEMGVSSTYFFLLTSPFYNSMCKQNRNCIEQILELGHRIGLHFSTHQYWSSEPREQILIERVRTENQVLSEYFSSKVHAVSFHIPPDWILCRKFEEFISTYEPRFFDEIAYRGDSNQRWRENNPFESDIPDYLQVLVHPGLWGIDDASFEERLKNQRDQRFNETSEFLEYQFIEDAVQR